MKTIKQIEQILKTNHFEVEKSISGYFRLLKYGMLIHDEPACEDVKDYEDAVSYFYDHLTSENLYEVYLSHDFIDDMKNRHYLCNPQGYCIDTEDFSYNETDAAVFVSKQDAEEVANAINSDIIEEGIEGAKAIVCKFELLDEIDEDE